MPPDASLDPAAQAFTGHPRKVYTFVPKQDWSRPWSDADLYARYGITQDEIDFIEKVVRPMDLSSDLLGDVEVSEVDDE